MTTEVSIKNKLGIVLAADSAATAVGIGMGGTQAKVYNSANKLFTLSKTDPVGVLVYNASGINGVPAEIIIKEFREQCKTYKTLKKYQGALLKFIEELIRKKKLGLYIFDFYKAFINEITASLDHVKAQDGDKFNYEEFINKHKMMLIQAIRENNCDNLEIIPYNTVIKKIETDFKFQNTFKDFKDINSYPYEISSLNELFYMYLKYVFCRSYTGIAVCGYGAGEFYPKVYKIHIYGVLENHLYTDNAESYETEDAEVIPLAQKQMIDTFMRGVSDKLYNQLEQLHIGNFSAFLDLITPSLKEDVDKEVLNARLMSAFNKNKETFKNMVFELEQRPLLQTLNFLSREEMAELAESLINIQVLKYKVSPDLETVGGPIDVAIISKHDGFVWKKRKLYFPRELNFQFFENYFK